MSKCKTCGGSGECQNGIHDSSGWAEDLVNAVAGDLFKCPDCGKSCDTPGDCPDCDGTGEVD